MFRVTSPVAIALTGLLLGSASRAAAQSAKTGTAKSASAASGKSSGSGKGAAATSAAQVQGAWSGTATVQLGDSTITVPVMYTFVANNGTTGGTAVVPGQGSGQISNVVREGARLRFRVTAPEGRLLEHDGQVASEQLIEGMVYMDQKPLAKFRITPSKTAPKNSP